MAGEAKSPKIAAGSMKFLEINLYYLANYDSYQSMKAVEPTYDQLASRNTCGARMWYVLWGMLGWGIAVFPMILGGGNGSGWFLTMLGLVVYFSDFVLIYRHQKSGEFDRAKKVINEVKAKVDVPRMQKLDAEFGGTPQAQRLLGQAQATLDSFLQGAKLLPA